MAPGLDLQERKEMVERLHGIHLRFLVGGERAFAVLVQQIAETLDGLR